MTRMAHDTYIVSVMQMIIMHSKICEERQAIVYGDHMDGGIQDLASIRSMVRTVQHGQEYAAKPDKPYQQSNTS